MGIKYKIVEMSYTSSPAPEILSQFFNSRTVGEIVDVDRLVSEIQTRGMEIDPITFGSLKIFVNLMQKIKHNHAGTISLQYHSL